MFQFVDSNNVPLSAVDATYYDVMRWQLPVVLGGERLWALRSNRSITIGTTVYQPYSRIIDWSAPVYAESPSTSEPMTVDLPDEDGAWKSLLTNFHIGTQADIWTIMVSNGVQAVNPMHHGRGWLSPPRYFEDDAGRRVELTFENEIATNEDDATVPMTHDQERSVDETTSSLSRSAHAVQIAWGSKQGSRRYAAV